MSGSATLKAKIIRVDIEADASGLFLATSPDLKGLLVAKKSMDDVIAAIPVHIRNLFLACDVEVTVAELESKEKSWVAVPKIAAAEPKTASMV